MTTEHREDSRSDNEHAWATSSQKRKLKTKAKTPPRKRQSISKYVTKSFERLDIESRNNTEVAVTALPTPSPSPMPAARPLSLLICGLGNPGPTYANTLHSAGNIVLSRLAERLGYSSFQKDRSLGNGLVSKPSSVGDAGDWTLWQSTAYMNESGKVVRAAWTTWSRNVAEGESRLVIVHDELERPLGAVTLKTAQGASAKGHNGLKSIMSVIGNTPFARIGIGIGRPVSRDSDDVARYVLKKMTSEEKAKLEGCVDEVITKLRQLEKG